jgi:hypothetical protein
MYAPAPTSALPEPPSGDILCTGALECATAGFPVFPVIPRGKSPARKNWQRSATTDLDVVESVWEGNAYNVGIATGNGLAVIDVDNLAGQAALDEIGLPPTTTVETAKGHHYYFKIGYAKTSTGILRGVDIRGEGGLVVAPNSIHPSGSRYVWHTPPWEMPPQPMPTELASALEDAAKRAKAHLSVTYSTAVVLEGERNATMFRVARSLVFHTGLTKEELLPALLEYNAQRCDPPLPDAEVRAIARSAGNYEFAPWVVNPLGFASDPRLSSNERFILATLARYVNPRGECFPTIERLRADTGMNRNAIQRAIDGLEAAGRITVQRGGRGRSNRYKLTSE